MGYGIEVKNNAGDLIIDGVNKNFAQAESGSVTLAANTITTISFTTATPQIPIIAIRPSANYVHLVDYQKSGSNWTGFRLFSRLGGTIYWRMYLAHPVTKAENYGLNIYDASGNLVFDSARAYFKIYSVTTGITLATTGATQTITHAGIENPYYLWGADKIAIQAQFIGGHWQQLVLKTGIKQTSSTSVTIAYDLIHGFTGTPDNYFNNNTQKLIVLK
jgi:hypothetical protein